MKSEFKSLKLYQNVRRVISISEENIQSKQNTVKNDNRITVRMVLYPKYFLFNC